MANVLQSSPPPSALGVFGLLPPEIRACIWYHLMPQHRPVTDPSQHWRLIFSDESVIRSAKRAFGLAAILRSSRQLYEEISSQLYSRDLVFTYNCGSWFSGSYHTASIDDLPGAVTQNLTNANFSRFTSIVFRIHVSRWPLSRASHNVMETVAMISDRTHYCLESNSTSLPRSLSLPHISIIFIEKEKKWGDYKLDIEGYLRCFRLLRGAESAFIELPDESKHLASIAEEVETLMMSNEPVSRLALEAAITQSSLAP